MRGDKEVALIALKNESGNFNWLENPFKKDKNFITEVIKVNPDVIQYLDDKYKSDKKIRSFVLEVSKIKEEELDRAINGKGYISYNTKKSAYEYYEYDLRPFWEK